jgi:hypothetical protein
VRTEKRQGEKGRLTGEILVPRNENYSRRRLDIQCKRHQIHTDHLVRDLLPPIMRSIYDTYTGGLKFRTDVGLARGSFEGGFHVGFGGDQVAVGVGEGAEGGDG